MNPNDKDPSKNTMHHLLGIGLDSDDGHKRITQAERFSIVGGSEETHDKMTETVIKTFETLDRKGKHSISSNPVNSKISLKSILLKFLLKLRAHDFICLLIG